MVAHGAPYGGKRTKATGYIIPHVLTTMGICYT